MLPLSLRTPHDVQLEIAARFRARRLAMNLTQEGLAVRSGVNLASLRRFERTGLIAFDLLLRVAHALDCLDDFDGVCADRSHEYSGKSLDEILAKPKTRKKGSVK